jgi:hypothetical protein
MPTSPASWDRSSSSTRDPETGALVQKAGVGAGYRQPSRGRQPSADDLLTTASDRAQGPAGVGGAAPYVGFSSSMRAVQPQRRGSRRSNARGSRAISLEISASAESRRSAVPGTLTLSIEPSVPSPCVEAAREEGEDEARRAERQRGPAARHPFAIRDRAVLEPAALRNAIVPLRAETQPRCHLNTDWNPPREGSAAHGRVGMSKTTHTPEAAVSPATRAIAPP